MTRSPSLSRWPTLLPADPLPWLLASDEAALRCFLYTGLLDRPLEDPEVRAARLAVREDPAVRALVGRLPDWEVPTTAGGHNSPAFAPNLLCLLHDLGLRGGDEPLVEGLLDAMLRHADEAGRFMTLGRMRGAGEPYWGSLFCDNHAITLALIRFGRAADPAVGRAVERIAKDMEETAQGPGWLCRPDPVSRFRGPGRKAEICPQVTLEALAVFALLPEVERPPAVLTAARSCLGVWRERATVKPYMFGHGRQFKTVKWPNFWYDVAAVLDTLSRYPALWRGAAADPADRLALAELAACLIVYNFNADGRVVPRSCYKGFEAFSFGQKKQPSPFATAKLCAILSRLEDLADEIAAIDVLALGSSKGGSGTVLPPK